MSVLPTTAWPTIVVTPVGTGTATFTTTVATGTNKTGGSFSIANARFSARVTAVQRDLDGQTHVAVVLVDDPAADLHEWYGRYLYFAPDELEPLESAGAAGHPEREEGPA